MVLWFDYVVNLGKTKETFCIAAALVDAQVGNWETGLFFCGSNVVKANKIERVQDIISELFD